VVANQIVPALAYRCRGIKFDPLTVYGDFDPLPNGYALRILPPNATFKQIEKPKSSEEKPKSSEEKPRWRKCWPLNKLISWFLDEDRDKFVDCDYNLVGIAIAIGQLLFAVTTLWQTARIEATYYGYAAYGLTVIPYAWMSLINSLALLVCPHYPNLYVVESETLDDLRKHHEDERKYPKAEGEGPQAKDNGLVAEGKVWKKRPLLIGVVDARIDSDTERKLQEEHDSDRNKYCQLLSNVLQKFADRNNNEMKRPEFSKKSVAGMIFSCSWWRSVFRWAFFIWFEDWTILFAIPIAAVPIFIVAGITQFQPQSSEAYQRVLVMLWLCWGSYEGPLVIAIVDALIDPRPRVGPTARLFPLCLLFAGVMAVLSAPAVAGFVVVVRMIREFGICTEIPI
jgi:hypothetical protein